MEKKKTFEASMKRIEEIVALLEKGDVPIEESLSLYEEAVVLMKDCGKTLEQAEQKVTMLASGRDKTPEELPFLDSDG